MTRKRAFFGAVLFATSFAPGARAQQPPPPWTGQPTSTSGTALMPPEAPAAAPGAAPATGGDPALAARVAALEAKVAEEKKTQELSDEDRERLNWLKHFKVSGFVQPQLVWSWFNTAASPNLQANGQLPPGVGANDVTALPGGGTTNADVFRIRRARLRTEFMPGDYARVVFEIDPTPPNAELGSNTTILRTVEAQGIAHWTPSIVTEFALGLFKVPFGFEVLQNDADRPFIERSWGERNLFPGEFDTGARAYTTAMGGRLVAQLAFVNGQTIGERTFALQPDLNKGKDLVGRVNYDFGPFDVGLSGYYGQGQVVDPTALAFKQFARYAVDLEAALHKKFFPRLGESRAFAEIVRAENMDRGVYYGALSQPAIPANVFNGSVNGLDELSYWIRVEQDLTRWFTAGLRYDYYSPNSAQGTNGRDTFGAVIAWNVTTGLKLMAEYDHAVDNVHAPGASAPSREIDTASGVLQARF